MSFYFCTTDGLFVECSDCSDEFVIEHHEEFEPAVMWMLKHMGECGKGEA